jgi:uncharacterized protein DUF1706
VFKLVLLDLLREAHLEEDAFVRDLDATERAATGTPDHWSAKDHIAHIAHWRARLALRLQAVLEHRDQPDLEPWERVNPLVFEEHRHQSWPDVLAGAEEAHAVHVDRLARLTDEDLLTAGRFAWVPDDRPLHDLVMGASYEHAQQHLAQFHVDRGDLPRATRIQELWVARVMEAETPPEMRGLALYNLACFQATHDQRERAVATLERALAIHPGSRLADFATTDPDLAALRD